jgi:transcriptional regulator with XRE-family HTH domain
MTSETPIRYVRRVVFGATQDTLAEIGQVSRSRVSRYESGDEPPPYNFLSRLRREAIRRGLPFSAEWFFEPPVAADESAKFPTAPPSEGKAA